MRKMLYARVSACALSVAVAAASPAFAQGRHGCPAGMTGACPSMMGDAAHAGDMQVFQQLFDHRMDITRRVIPRPDGVETVTESANPAVTQLLQTHVVSMLGRVQEGRPIHRRDPLFAELFKHAARIDARHELTDRGVRVLETSADAYVVKLIQAHAAVVSAFIANGRSEMMKNHPLPERK